MKGKKTTINDSTSFKIKDIKGTLIAIEKNGKPEQSDNKVVIEEHYHTDASEEDISEDELRISHEGPVMTTTTDLPQPILLCET